MNEHETQIIDITSLSHGAAAIGTLADKKVFVENACPGDKAKVEIYDHKDNLAYANLIELIEVSDRRADAPKCILHKVCGSCQWQHIEYAEQLKFKRANLIDQLILQKVEQTHMWDLDGGTQRAAKVETIMKAIPETLGMTGDPYFYRNKVIYPVKTVPKTGRMLAGYYKRKSNELVNIKHCPIQYSIFDQYLELIKEKASQMQIGAPLIRHILLRASEDQEQVLVGFIIRKKLYDKVEDRKKFLRIFRWLARTFPSFKVGTINFNDDSTNVILGTETELLYGEQDYIVDNIDQAKVQISTSSFFQINNQQFCKILAVIKDFARAQLVAGAKVLDAYAGIGTISLNLAKEFPESAFHAFELVPEAVNNAQANIKLNNLENYQIEMAKAEEFCINHDLTEFNLVIVNPPRKGCTNKVLDSLKDCEQIVYVSCNPASLARDIKYLERSGFKLARLQPVDMFPHSFHLECVALITKEI
jgi:23S rRNA (uracil1939-C5)-methyltransferase